MYLPANKGEEINITFRSVLLNKDIGTISTWLKNKATSAYNDPFPAFTELIDQYTNILLSDCAYALMVLEHDNPIFLIELHQASVYYSKKNIENKQGDFYINLLLSAEIKMNPEVFITAFNACLSYFFSLRIISRVLIPTSNFNPFSFSQHYVTGKVPFGENEMIVLEQADFLLA